MNRYRIYCTEEQAKKALELGAPIEYASITDIKLKRYVSVNNEEYVLPTAEQMIGWLEEQRIFVHLAPCVDLSCSWLIASEGYNEYEYTSNIMVGKNRKAATIAAIDAALDYLTNKNK